ncbi:MAG: hypothetical protein LRY54_00155 [Alphaproteobacteria bacterium]|nr:hypothetical protein [Alphaproteobacteria bacterium]
MITLTRFSALAVFALSLMAPVPGQAQEDGRTAGRKAGEEVSTAPQSSEKTEESDKKAEASDKADDQKEQKQKKTETTPAKESPNKKPRGEEKILKVDFADIESIGLYSSPQEGSLGRDLWTNSHRSLITDYLPKLQVAKKSPVLQFLTDGLLLSRTQAGLIVNDTTPEPGKDLLTLRLMKLMDLGMNDQALKIYSDLGRTPYHPNLAQAGIMAMLFNGEKSLACLEYKTVEDRNFQGPFWTDIALYCNYVLEDKKPTTAELKTTSSQAIQRILSGGSYTFTYDARKLENVPLIDRAILTAENIINFGDLGLEGIKRMAPAHLTLALKKQKLSRQDEFLLKMKMVQYGLSSPAEWEKLYAGYKFGGAADEQKIIPLESLPGWQQLPALYQNAKAVGRGVEQQNTALKALDYVGTYGLAAAYPFADMLEDVPANNLSTEQLAQIARVMNGADKDIPGSWFEVIGKRKPASDKDMALYVLSYVAKAYQRTNPEDRNIIMAAVERIKNPALKESFKIIIENVDNGNPDQHTADKVYDNDLDLTFDGNYVMPSKRVWDRLIASSQNQSIGETVLLSTLLLGDKPLMDLYPGVLGDVLKGLRAVGLTRFSKGMAQEALLETIE